MNEITDFPTIELGDKTYTVRMSRGLLYRLGKLDIPIDFKKTGVNLVSMSFTRIVDIYHAILEFQGTHEELAELLYERRSEAVNKFLSAMGKAGLLATKPLAPAAPQADPKDTVALPN